MKENKLIIQVKKIVVFAISIIIVIQVSSRLINANLIINSHLINKLKFDSIEIVFE